MLFLFVLTTERARNRHADSLCRGEGVFERGPRPSTRESAWCPTRFDLFRHDAASGINFTRLLPEIRAHVHQDASLSASSPCLRCSKQDSSGGQAISTREIWVAGIAIRRDMSYRARFAAVCIAHGRPSMQQREERGRRACEVSDLTSWLSQAQCKFPTSITLCTTQTH